MGVNDKLAATLYPYVNFGPSEEVITRVPKPDNVAVAIALLEEMVDVLKGHLVPEIWPDLDEDFNTIVTQLNKGRRLERRIKNALEMMDHSQYGDPEVPFRMRELLDPK